MCENQVGWGECLPMVPLDDRYSVRSFGLFRSLHSVRSFVLFRSSFRSLYFVCPFHLLILFIPFVRSVRYVWLFVPLFLSFVPSVCLFVCSFFPFVCSLRSVRSFVRAFCLIICSVCLFHSFVPFVRSFTSFCSIVRSAHSFLLFACLFVRLFRLFVHFVLLDRSFMRSVRSFVHAFC